VRHTLSSNKGFIKVSRKGSDNGKGFWWTINPAHESLFDNQPPGSTIRPTIDTSASRLPTTADQGPSLSKQPSPKKVPDASGASLTPQPRADAVPPEPKEQGVRDETIAHNVSPPRREQPQTPASVVIPIIIKELSPDHPAVVSSAASSGPASALLAVPPIVHDRENCALVLNPTVFGELATEELERIQNLGFSKALEELSPYIVKFVKKKLTTTGKPGKKSSKLKNREKANTKAANEVGTPSASMTTTLPSASLGEPPLKKRKTEDLAAASLPAALA
jgi:hypothetical protein